MMTGRIGGVASHLRDGPSGNSGAGASPGAGGSGGGIPDPSATIVPLSENGAGIQRISPDQEMHTARVEATQEIRQLREQQTQDALTNRVKQLSMASGREKR
ncbi:hypothetical protein BGW38_001517 [Lunasporangiospora selenospora]|uniref:Uncharacterized protein n=1 Tax=Lunasporangiospora selenospora TaxID=979761 RepID=A0A9P6FTL6_9FUNG|nr:hypothetical protein BGW38_001517 [Lunasporangiospora selenospora]